MSRALFALSANHWANGRIIKSGVVNIAPGDAPQDYLHHAFEDVQRTGVAFITYDA